MNAAPSLGYPSVRDRLPVRIRDGRADDEAFVVSSWLKSFAASSTAASLGQQTYYERWHRIIPRVMERGRTLIATPHVGDSDVIVGFLVYEAAPSGAVVHYAYVRDVGTEPRELRGQYARCGIASQLFEYAGLATGRFTYTHRTTFSQVITDARRRAGRIVPRFDFTRIWE